MRQILYWDKEKKRFIERITRADIEAQKIGFNVITDEMPPTRHPCNGKMYTSKTKFRTETRAHDCVEVGTESLSKHVGRPESINIERIANESWEKLRK